MKQYPPPDRFVPRHRGGISDRRLRSWTGFEHLRNLENLRLCWALNKIGGLHRVRPPKLIRMFNLSLPQFSVQKANRTGSLYVVSDFDIGPYLKLRYGNPEVRWTAMFRSRELLVTSMGNRRGIIRFIMHGGKKAHIGLWKCDRVLYTFNRFFHPATERVEFWLLGEFSRCMQFITSVFARKCRFIVIHIQWYGHDFLILISGILYMISMNLKTKLESF